MLSATAGLAVIANGEGHAVPLRVIEQIERLIRVGNRCRGDCHIVVPGDCGANSGQMGIANHLRLKSDDQIRVAEAGIAFQSQGTHGGNEMGNLGVIHWLSVGSGDQFIEDADALDDPLDLLPGLTFGNPGADSLDGVKGGDDGGFVISENSGIKAGEDLSTLDGLEHSSPFATAESVDGTAWREHHEAFHGWCVSAGKGVTSIGEPLLPPLGEMGALDGLQVVRIGRIEEIGIEGGKN